MDLSAFAEEVGAEGPVTCVGARRQWDVGGSVANGAGELSAPSGIEQLKPEEMTVSCGAGTPVDELAAALAEHGQRVALPPWGTVGGVLAVGRSDERRLGHGPVRDALLQARMVTAEGRLIRAGGPTVKNVSGFDLCRLFVGSLGTLGFFGDVILRTRPQPATSQWFRAADDADPFALFRSLYRPASVLWDGSDVWVLLEGHPLDVAEEASRFGLDAIVGPPALPPHRHSVPPSALRDLHGEFVAEIGIGLVHRSEPPAPRTQPEAVVGLHGRLKERFDPTGRLNPGRDPLLM